MDKFFRRPLKYFGFPPIIYVSSKNATFFPRMLHFLFYPFLRIPFDDSCPATFYWFRRFRALQGQIPLSKGKGMAQDSSCVMPFVILMSFSSVWKRQPEISPAGTERPGSPGWTVPASPDRPAPEIRHVAHVSGKVFGRNLPATGL